MSSWLDIKVAPSRVRLELDLHGVCQRCVCAHVLCTVWLLYIARASLPEADLPDIVKPLLQGWIKPAARTYGAGSTTLLSIFCPLSFMQCTVVSARLGKSSPKLFGLQHDEIQCEFSKRFPRRRARHHHHHPW